MLLYCPLPPPSSTLFPYTTLFRSTCRVHYFACSGGASSASPSPLPLSLPLPLSSPSGKCATETTRSPSPTLNTTRSEEHTSELQSRLHLVCRLLLEKKKQPIAILT